MGWQDRDYSRGYRGGGNPLMWLLSGSVPLFRAFGIDVRAHASLVIVVIFGLLLGFEQGYAWQDKLESVGALFLIVLLHEFGHCFACRWVGGSADEIIMHPLGGLALCGPPHRPLPTFITVAGGPAVNVLICLVCGLFLLFEVHWLPSNPFRYYPLPLRGGSTGMRALVMNAYWIYEMSYSLLVFNLLPIYPLDGGQMLQAILWPHMGFYRSMKISTEIGMLASVAAAAFALSSGNIGLAVLAGLGFYYCYVMRARLLADGGPGLDEMSYAIGPDPVPKQARQSWLAKRRAARASRAEIVEIAEVDRILAKVGESGMNSLSSREKKTLAQASANQRKRDQTRGRR